MSELDYPETLADFAPWCQKQIAWLSEFRRILWHETAKYKVVTIGTQAIRMPYNWWGWDKIVDMIGFCHNFAVGQVAPKGARIADLISCLEKGESRRIPSDAELFAFLRDCEAYLGAAIQWASTVPAETSGSEDGKMIVKVPPTETLPYVPTVATAKDLAHLLEKPVGKVEQFLRRHREKAPDCFIEINKDDRRRNEPRYLYRVAEVLPILKQHFTGKWQDF